MKPICRVVGDVLDEHLDVGVDALGAGHEAGLELLDQLVGHAADEAELAALGLQRGGGADEERALLLGEHDVVHVVGLDDGVDEQEVRVGVGGRRLGDRVATTGTRWR